MEMSEAKRSLSEVEMVKTKALRGVGNTQLALTRSGANGMLSGKFYGLIIRPFLRSRHSKGE